MYKTGRAFLDDGKYEEAEQVFRQGVNQGDPRCAYGLFVALLARGMITEQAVEEFIEHLPEIMELANEGDAAALFIIGRCYETGCGLCQNLSEAIRCYQIASARGNIDAHFNLGCIYTFEKSVEDRKKGLAHFRVAAAFGSREAAYNLEKLSRQTKYEQVQAREKQGEKPEKGGT